MTVSSLLDLIGNTPLVELSKMASPDTEGVRIFAKLEGQNPSGSIKDRIVKAMVEQAETQGRLKSGDTIIEASSGNTAIASCMVGKQRGYNVTVVIPPEVVPSIADILRLLGAEVVWCEPGLGMKGAIDHAQALAKANGWQYLGQFDDRTNMETHYAATGREIVEALDPVDVFVAGIGTAGTIMGVGKRLKEANPKVKVIGVEPRMGQSLQGLRSLSEGYVPPLLDLKMLSGRFLVDSATAITAAKSVIEAEGIMAGVSSGATLHVAQRIARRMAAQGEKGNIVAMFSDGAWKYLPSRPWGAALDGDSDLDETHWW